MSLISCEFNFNLTWSEDFVIASAVEEKKFAVNTKLFVPVVTLSIQYNVQLLKQLGSGFERKINWNKYQSKVSIERQNQYLDYLIDLGFQEINILSVLSFENKNDRKTHTGSFLPKAEIKDDNFMIDERNFFDYPIKSDQITYDNIRKIANGCSLNYLYFKEHYKLILMDLSKQALDAYPKAMQQTGFAENLEQDGNTQMSFIIVEAKKIFYVFRKEPWRN